jgi:hypothetical protein
VHEPLRDPGSLAPIQSRQQRDADAGCRSSAGHVRPTISMPSHLGLTVPKHAPRVRCPRHNGLPPGPERLSTYAAATEARSA